MTTAMPWSCWLCDRRFAHGRDLITHLEVFHPQECAEMRRQLDLGIVRDRTL